MYCLYFFHKTYNSYLKVNHFHVDGLFDCPPNIVYIVQLPKLFPAYPFVSGVPVGEPGTKPEITTFPTGS